MKDMKTALAFMAAMLALASHAGLKYWTSGPYDADSYVQDGLVLNYDGIRNVGIDQPHSTTTTTWVNLANPGTHDLSFYVTKAASGGTLNWQDDGYLFNNGTVFREMSSGLVVPGKQTTQVLMDVTSAAQGTGFGYVWFPYQVGTDNTYWSTWSVSVRGTGTDAIWYNTHKANSAGTLGTTDRPKWSGTQFSYLTAIANETYTAAFSGTSEPTGATGRYATKSGTTFPDRTIGDWSLGGQPSSASNPLNGSIKSFRFYSNKVLSEEELAWNRAVDQTRFFGAAPLTEISVTNAVIASAVAVVHGNEKSGAYAVDASGYTFTAPASRIVEGREYICTGYTLETWDDATGTWGDAQTESGTSVAVTASDRVRITWQWTGGDGIVTRYTVADYVQDGLVLHYDGIRNEGAGEPHSAAPAKWSNLAPAGGWDMAFHTKSGVTKPGEWRANGYRFEQQSWFSPGAAITLPSNQTVQIAVEANGLDQEAYRNNSNQNVNESYLYYNSGTFNKAGSISLRRDNNATGNEYFDWSTHGYGDSTATGNALTRPSPCQPTGTPLRYVTAILADDYTAAFLGTSIPTTTSSTRFVTFAVRMALASTPQVQTASGNGFYIGGLADDTLRKFRGTIHNFRFYNRVLTNEELAQNRVVDDYRFHGIMPVTNVVVATSHSFFAGNEANGNYEISGRYTFSAPTARQTDSRGFEYTFVGYALETWDAAAQGWSDPVFYESGSYEYVVGTSPAKVRLTWRWNCTKALRTAADFGLEDVVPNGLVLHYDGIKNIGVESADVSNPTSAWSRAWANLVDPGAFTLSRQNKSKEKAGVWATDGFAFENPNSNTGSWFQCSAPLTLTPAYTWQFLVDAKVSDQRNALCTYLMFNSEWKSGSLGVRTTSDYNYGLYYVADNAFNTTSDKYRPKILDTRDANSKYTYATAILKGKKAMLFAGTDYPTDAEGLKTGPNDATAQALTKINIGGGQGSQDFTGKISSIRYYDRVLTTEELVRNRNVDSARYFGELATTNVFVEASGGTQAETGAYKVEGSWTFTATTVMKQNGTVVPVTRYAVETLANGAWTDKTWHDGASYTYTEGTDPAAVRLTWRGAQEGTMLLFR